VKFFNWMVRPGLIPFPFGIPKSQHGQVLAKCSLAAVATGANPLDYSIWAIMQAKVKGIVQRILKGVNIKLK
jgi:hypothetical protein